MIRYLDHSIMEVTNIQTNEILWELSHWYVSDDAPQTAGRVINGYYKSKKEAQEMHNQLLVKALIENEPNPKDKMQTRIS